MSREPSYEMKRGPDGTRELDQGLVYGLPCRYDPNDRNFALYAPGASGGATVLTSYASWRNIVRFARRYTELPDKNR